MGDNRKAYVIPITMARVMQKIKNKIGSGGFIPLDAVMAVAMMDPEVGYYTQQKPLGKEGDFVTAPEVSQLFGEVIGLWFASLWLNKGSPDVFHFVELGAGRGTFLADMLRITKSVPGFHDALCIHIVDINPALRTLQQAVLQGFDAVWWDTLKEALVTLSPHPIYVFANEFFDVFPLKQLHCFEGQWHELGLSKDGSPAHRTTPFSKRFKGADEGVVEYSRILRAHVRQLYRYLETCGGSSLIIDYGYDRGGGDTLQALKGHMPCLWYEHLGEADVTSHVDFGWMARQARMRGLKVLGPTPQGILLKDLGIDVRFDRLLATLEDPRARALLRMGYERLVHPSQMGHLFKALMIER